MTGGIETIPAAFAGKTAFTDTGLQCVVMALSSLCPDKRDRKYLDFALR